MAKYRLKYPTVPESEGRMLDELTDCLANHDICQEIVRAIMLTLSEAFTNAMIHGNDWDNKKSVQLDLQVNENVVVADISDEGSGGLSRVQKSKPGGLLADHGRGLGLMKHFSTKLDIAQTETGGLKVRAIFELNNSLEIGT
ncbi:MAG: ATP-binding protein [candidate division Zixibacteria bacterium]